MRKEHFSINNFVHVYNRGNRKQPIVHDQRDKWHFLQMLYYFNTQTSVDNPFNNLRKLRLDLNQHLMWPEDWPERKPIVKILAFVLMENHFHLLLKEIQEGGISLFMKKLGNGIAGYFNTKYQETGRLFQGSYKAKHVDNDTYLRYLSVCIQVKNTFELFPGGLEAALQEFDRAFDWAVKYPYCSLGDYAGTRNSPILDKDVFGEIFSDRKEYKDFARECMLARNLDKEVEHLIFEE